MGYPTTHEIHIFAALINIIGKDLKYGISMAYQWWRRRFWAGINSKEIGGYCYYLVVYLCPEGFNEWAFPPDMKEVAICLLASPTLIRNRSV